MLTADSAYELAMDEGRRKMMADQINEIEALIIETCKQKGTWAYREKPMLPEVINLLEVSGYTLQRDYHGLGTTIYWIKNKS
jgi:hypothetical protein